jgi:hypothetical protein
MYQFLKHKNKQFINPTHTWTPYNSLTVYVEGQSPTATPAYLVENKYPSIVFHK